MKSDFGEQMHDSIATIEMKNNRKGGDGETKSTETESVH